MISASEAKKITKDHKGNIYNEVEDLLNKIEERIKSVASFGFETFQINLMDMLRDSLNAGEVKSAFIDALINLGYTVSNSRSNPYLVNIDWITPKDF